MDLQLRPEIQRFVDAKVKAGEFASTKDLVEAGIARLMREASPEMDQPRAGALQKGRTTREFREEGRPWDQILGKYF
jgi:hypothetical protein